MSNISRPDAVRIRHMVEAAQQARSFVQDRERSDLDTDHMLALAVVRLLEIIGEAASRVTGGVRLDNPQIPWQEISGTRHRLIHGYFNVDYDIVWSILQDDLPSLIAHLEVMLAVSDVESAGPD